MRVLFYDSGGDRTGGGRTMARVAHGLNARGHDVTFACPAESPLAKHLAEGAFALVRTSSRSMARSVWRVAGEITDRQVEIIFVRSGRDHTIAAAAIRLARARTAVLRRIGHGETGGGNGVAPRLAPSGYVFALEEDRRRWRRPSSVRLDPTVAPIGVEISAYADVRPAPSMILGGGDGGVRNMVCVCDEDGRSAVATAMRTMALLAPRHPELRLIVIGPGSQNTDLRMHAAALHIAPRVILFGARDDTLAILRTAEIGWVVAHGEAGAWAMLDLLALGVPLVAEKGVLARHFIVDGITGLQLPPGDPPEAAALIARLLSGDQERSAMAAAARSRVAREFGDAAMLSAFEQAAVAVGDVSR